MILRGCGVGIIPAHAGLTPDSRRAWRAGRDHPRACGAHSTICPTARRKMGSSPRMRGSQRYISRRVDEEGIIPAHAGLTPDSRRAWRAGRDHPRACGAHMKMSAQQLVDKGSSPRMRGSQFGHELDHLDAGIIPAHAGLTRLCFHAISSSWDHPRACGAHRT